MTDNSITVNDQSSGTEVDSSAVTRADGTVVNRQRMNVSDPDDPNAHANVRGELGRGGLNVTNEDLLEQLKIIAIATQEINFKLSVAFKL